MCATVLQPKTAKINKKIPYFGSSGSFKVINVDMTEKLKLVLVVISSTPTSICNHFYERLAHNGKIMTFTAVPLFDALMCRFPST